ncbi:MAG: hypothetical protein ACYS7M_08000 [Planctomycetota bacterium]|jgi:hypothetical protein
MPLRLRAHGGISISFPELTDTDESMPPYESPTADVAVRGATTFPASA